MFFFESHEINKKKEIVKTNDEYKRWFKNIFDLYNIATTSMIIFFLIFSRRG